MEFLLEPQLRKMKWSNPFVSAPPHSVQPCRLQALAGSEVEKTQPPASTNTLLLEQLELCLFVCLLSIAAFTLDQMAQKT